MSHRHQFKEVYSSEQQKPIAQNGVAHTAPQPSPNSLRLVTLIPPKSAGEGYSVCFFVWVLDKKVKTLDLLHKSQKVHLRR